MAHSLDEVVRAIFPQGAAFSTHQIADDHNLARMLREERQHVIYGNQVLEWLDQRPIPTLKQLKKAEAELKGEG